MLSPSQVQDYYSSQSSSKTPLSPAQYEASLAKPAPAPVAPPVTPPDTTGANEPGANVANQGNPGYDVFGAPVATTTPPATTSASTPTALPDQTDRDALAQTQTDYQAQSKQVQDTLTNIQNGATPLSAGEQAQIDGLKGQFQQLIDAQKLTNTGAQGQANLSAARGGALEYDANVARNIAAVTSAGAAKVADLQVKEASAVASLTQSLKDNDIKAVKDAWAMYQDASKARQEALQKTIDDTQKAIKDAQDAKIAADKVQYDEVTKPIQDIAEQVLKNTGDAKLAQQIGAAPDVSTALTLAGDSIQTATGDLGDYLGYKRQAKVAGTTPMTFDSWKKAKDVADTKQAAAKAYATAYATESAKSQFTDSSANQQKLEQQYRTVLTKELSNRSGGLGLQDAKVNQAIHLKALYDQYFDPKTGNYNVPAAQYSELVFGLANLVSPTGTTAESDRTELRSKTAAGDLKGAVQYITGTPQNGNTQQIIKNLIDSINRQGTIAEQERGTYLDFVHGLAPTDLDPSRQQALEKNELNSFTNPKNDPLIQNGIDSKKGVDDFVTKYPKSLGKITNLYAVAGVTDADVLEYIGEHPELAQ